MCVKRIIQLIQLWARSIPRHTMCTEARVLNIRPSSESATPALMLFYNSLKCTSYYFSEFTQKLYNQLQPVMTVSWPFTF